MTSFGVQCPHCDALFKVYPDQLRLHNGFASCAVCGLAFDVQAALLSLPPHQTHFIQSSPYSIDGLPVLNATVTVDFDPIHTSPPSSEYSASNDAGAQG